MSQKNKEQSNKLMRPNAGRSDAPGDPPIVADFPVMLDHPFRFGREWISRLAMRDIKQKEAFTIVDASGTYFRASLKELHPKGGRAVAYELMSRSPEPTIDLTLACTVLARQRMIFVMQKATELGVMRIVPLLTDHSVPPEGLEHEHAHSWPAQVVRAARQCRRASLPEVAPPVKLREFVLSETFRSADIRITLDDRSTPVSKSEGVPQRVVLIVGPEGGFSDNEREQLSENTRPWLLGGRILRAETAVIVGLTAVQMRFGDLQFDPPTIFVPPAMGA